MFKSVIIWLRKPNKSTLEQWIEAAVIILPIAFVIRTWGYGLYQVPSESMETTMLVGERFLADKFTVWFKSVKHGDIISFNEPQYPYSQNPVLNIWQRYFWGPSNWTKRVIGVPGDHVQGKIEEGKPVVYRNGVKLYEPYLNKYPLIMLWTPFVPTTEDLYTGNYNVRLCSYDPAKPYDKQPFNSFDSAMIVKTNGEPVIKYPQTPLEDRKDVFDVQLGENQYWVMGDNRLGSTDSRIWGPLDGKLIHGKIIFRIFSFDAYPPWSFFIFDQNWTLLDLIVHPISFWSKVRWSRCFQWVS